MERNYRMKIYRVSLLHRATIKKAKNGRLIRIPQPETIIERLFTVGSNFVRPVWPNILNTSESDPQISENPTRFESFRCPWDYSLVTWRSSQFSYLSTNSNIARIGLFSVVLDVLTYSTISQGYMLPVHETNPQI